MGITYNFKRSVNSYKYSNIKIKVGFYSSLISFSEQTVEWNSDTSAYLVGQRENFNIINPEVQLEMLKRIKKFSYELAKKKGKILYVNEAANCKFDGIVKFLSYKAGQNFVVGRWPCGLITKNKSLDVSCILLFNPSKSKFPIKEGNKLGLPIISLNNLGMSISKTMYPIICNNIEGNSAFFSVLLLSHSILEGNLFEFTKKHLKTF
uniref:Ribosomal protein S2 n=1 Tax=Chroomonas placoidea TaxID=173977 RepID=A0A2P1G8A3_9CRYP|nr:ribosomal protein S2 [Chroomonas placoidea]AVM81116.1 ribosomal protein S2 [Chroomonas placoidea]